MSDFDEVRRVLSNIRSVRVMAREVDFELLVEMHEKLGAAIEERRIDAEREKAEQAERENKRQELLQLIQSEGFDPQELISGESSKKKVKKASVSRKPKYQFEENGEVKQWAGVGRKPKAIQEALDQGRTLESFLIPTENQ
jgi:DNA-binding protein StpA